MIVFELVPDETSLLGEVVCSVSEPVTDQLNPESNEMVPAVELEIVPIANQR